MLTTYHYKRSMGTYSGQCRGRRIAGLLVSAAVAMTLAATTTTAAPFVDVTAFVVIGFGSVPPGVDATCNSCFDVITLRTSVAPVPGTTIAFDQSGSGKFTITNTSGDQLSGTWELFAEYSAFFPSDVGLGIDNPATQAASFASSVSGFGDSSVFSFSGFSDFHSCSIGFLGESGTVFSPTTCGVQSADFSVSSIFVDLSALGPRSSASISFFEEINASFTFQAVPEPPSLYLILVALSAMAVPAMRFLRS